MWRKRFSAGWSREAGVALFEHERLLEKNGVRKQGARVTAIETEAGDQFTARVFIDSTL